jgi:hypothetical protein
MKWSGEACDADGDVVLYDNTCTEIYRAAAIYRAAKSNTGFTMLTSCSNDIVAGTWGQQNIK